MRYVCDTPLYRFPAWSGGKTRLDDLVDHPDAYDYISNIYLGKHLNAGMSLEKARGIMDEMLKKLLFDVPEEYHIDRDHFYKYLEKYYTEKFSAG